MSNYVSQIRSAIETRLSTVLGVTYSELDYKLDVLKNNFRSKKKGYGCIQGDIFNVTGPLKHVTVDQTFTVILTDDFVNVSKNDANAITVAETLADKMNDIYVDLQQTKIGLATIILNIVLDSVDEPEYDFEDNIAIVRGNFTVKYRTVLT